MLYGGERVLAAVQQAFYVQPAVVSMPAQSAVVQQETFAPIMYVLTYAGQPSPVSQRPAEPSRRS